MFTVKGSYLEVCALLNGFELGARGGDLTKYHSWLLQFDAARPELTWEFLFLRIDTDNEEIPDDLEAQWQLVDRLFASLGQFFGSS